MGDSKTYLKHTSGWTDLYHMKQFYLFILNNVPFGHCVVTNSSKIKFKLFTHMQMKKLEKKEAISFIIIFLKRLK